MIEKEFKVSSIEDNKLVVDFLLSLINKKKYFLFDASMGAGKTTLIHSILLKLGILNFEGSPTYSLINEYNSKNYGNIYHIDLYRLNSIQEALDIGIEELIYNDAKLFIEWPNMIRSLLDETQIVDIKIHSFNNIRTFEIKYK